MEVQSIHPQSIDSDTPLTSIGSRLAPVVVTPTKDSTSHTNDSDDTIDTPNEDLLSTIKVDVEVDDIAIPVVTELEIDPNTGSSIATSTSTSPEKIVAKSPTIEKVIASTKKRPATISNNKRNSSSNSSTTPLSNTGSAKRIYETTTTTTSPSAVAKNWKQASMVHAELAALKQRGLAKLLNQHFTSTAQQLAIEKAAADAAILDLQERKARTREFTPTNSSEISPLDQACIQANKWRAECRRKERETLLLYQQYVHKFGPTTILPVPTVATTAATHDGTKIGGTKHVVVPTAPMVPPQPSISRPVPTLVPSMTAQIEQTLEEYCARGAVAHPSILTHGREQTYSSVAAKEEHTFREYYRKQLEAKGADAVCSPGYYKGNGTASDVFAPNTVFNEDDEQQEEWNKDDVCSIVSGLTTLHSAMTREFIHDCENSVQTFLRDEQATVRKLLEEEDQDYDASSSGDTHVSNVLIVQDSDATAKAAENMVQQMQEILQEYQMKHFGSGGANATVNNDVPVTEKEYPIAYPTKNANEKWVIYYDEFYRQEYYHEINTNRTQWDPPGKKAGDMNDPPDSSFSNSHSTDAYSVMNGGLAGSVYDDLGLYHDDDRMDRIIESNNHRVAVYRKRQRRKRLRRRMIGAITVIASILLCSGGVYYHTCNQNDSNKPTTCALIDNVVMEQWNQINELFVTLDKEKLISDVPPKPEQCMVRLIDEIDVLVRMKQMMVHHSPPEEIIRQEVIRRPWGCNIPLAYLFHSKCRRMATLQPIFDLQALINSMLQ